MFSIVTKLKLVKQQLKIWNRTSFKNIFEEKKKMEENIQSLNEDVISNGMDEARYKMEKNLLNKLEDVLAKEEI